MSQQSDEQLLTKDIYSVHAVWLCIIQLYQQCVYSS